MKLGFYPQLQKELKNSVGVAIRNFRQEEKAKAKKVDQGSSKTK